MNDAFENGPTGRNIPEETARRRFHIISLVRLMGAIFVLVGMLTANGNTGWPIWIGYLLIVTGLIDFFVIPPLLAKRWRSPD